MNNNLTYFEARQRASFYIKEHGKDASIADYLLMRRHKWTDTDLIMHYQQSMSLAESEQYHQDVDKYINGQPPQYIIGTAPFYGLDLVVNPAVLIPRFETEELVEWILNQFNEKPLKVLDVGTGSGAIALSLKQNRPDWQVVGSDISKAALQVAKTNAQRLNLNVEFVLSDLFNTINLEKFDLIVSNPPYIAQNELKYMGRDVIDYEPHLALFADHNGLLIYQRIASYLGTHHFRHQTLFVEIGFHQGRAVQQIFKDALPNASVTLKKDLTGNDRMIRVQY